RFSRDWSSNVCSSDLDWDFVQQVWDFIDSYWPQIADKQRRVYGIAPEKVEAAPVETPFGTYRGGYYPIAYDPQRSSRSAADTDRSEERRVGKEREARG